MSFLQQWATGTNKQTTYGTYDNVIPNTEPTSAAYTGWKSRAYSATRQTNHQGSVAQNFTMNDHYNFAKMWKLRKILKNKSKFNQSNMSA